MDPLQKKVIQHVGGSVTRDGSGFRLSGEGSFGMPEQIKLGPMRVAVASLREHGAKIDAMVCFVEDNYEDYGITA